MELAGNGRLDGPSIALFPGAWNPPTQAHAALAEAALAFASRVVFVLPRALPHKTLDGPSPERRLAWLQALAARHPAFSAARSEGGLFAEIARECRALAPGARLFLLCGSDAAHRIVHWPYPPALSIDSQLAEYELLVAPRPECYEPPPHLRSRVHTLPLPPDFRLVSSTEARRRLQGREDARPLIPPAIWDDVLHAYSL